MNAAEKLRLPAFLILVFFLVCGMACAQGTTLEAASDFIATPTTLRQVNGAYPAAHIVLFYKPCTRASAGSVVDRLTDSAWDVRVSGIGAVADNLHHDPCTISFDLKTVSTEHGTATVELINGKETKHAFLDFADPLAKPVPTRPKVDVLWGPISYNVCKHVFGKAVAKNFYCIAMKLGNNSGYALKLAGVGFRSRYVSKVRCDLMQTPDQAATDPAKRWCKAPAALPPEDEAKTPSSSYLITRAVLQDGAGMDWRSLTLHSMGATGLLMAGFAPYFHSEGASARYGTATSIVSAPLQAGFNLIFPDPSLRQQNNLDDQSLKETTIIPNNTQISTVVFLDKGSVSFSFNGPCARLFPDYVAKNAGTASTSTSNTTSASTKTQQSTGYERKQYETCIRGGLSSGIKEALGDITLVGDEIDYIERIVVDASNDTQQPPAGPRIDKVTADYDRLTIEGTALDKLGSELTVNGRQVGAETAEDQVAQRLGEATPTKAIYSIKPLWGDGVVRLLTDKTPLLSPYTVNISNQPADLNGKELSGKTLTLTGKNMRLIDDVTVVAGSKIYDKLKRQSVSDTTVTFTLPDEIAKDATYKLTFSPRTQVKSNVPEEDKAK